MWLKDIPPADHDCHECDECDADWFLAAVLSHAVSRERNRVIALVTLS